MNPVEVTMNHAGGCWHSKFLALISSKPGLIFISNKLHMKETYYLETKKVKAPTDLNQQLALLREHFCAKLLSNYKEEFDPEIFSCITTQYLLGRHLEIFGTLGIYFIRTFLL